MIMLMNSESTRGRESNNVYAEPLLDGISASQLCSYVVQLFRPATTATNKIVDMGLLCTIIGKPKGSSPKSAKIMRERMKRGGEERKQR